MINIYRPLSTKSIQHQLILALIFLAPLGWLTVRSWINGILVILSLFCLFFLIYNKNKIQLHQSDQIVIATFILPILAVLITQAYTNNWSMRPYDGPSRFLLGIPIYLYIRSEKINILPIIAIAIPLTLVFNLVSVLINTTPSEFWNNRLTTYFVDPLTFGNYSLILGFLSLLMVQYQHNLKAVYLKNIFQIACLTGFVIGLYLSLGSMSRSGWLAIPFLAIYSIWCLRKEIASHLNVFLVIIFFASLFCLFLLLSNEVIQARFLSIYSETNAWITKSRGFDSSSGGIRLSMWVLSYKLFMMNPLMGYGDLGYKDLLITDPNLIASASEIARTSMFNGPHNEILANSLRYGIFGLISSCSLFTTPAVIALLKMREENFAAKLIFSFIVSLLICSVALEVFNLKYTASFYAFLMPILLAASNNLKD